MATATRTRKTAPKSAPATGEKTAPTVTDAEIAAVIADALTPTTPAPEAAPETDTAPSVEALAHGHVMAIHAAMAEFDVADSAYMTARTVMVTCGVHVARRSADLYSFAVENLPDTIAKRGTNAGNPAVEKLATMLGYERRVFEKFYKSGLALIGANVPLDGDVTPEDIELVAPFLTKDAARKAAKRAADKESAGQSGGFTEADGDGDGGSPLVAPPVDSPVILADVMAAIKALQVTAGKFAAGNGLTRDAMDGIADAIADITATLEGVVAE